MFSKKKLVSLFLLVVIIRFFAGIYCDEEHNDYFFFIKHKPTWQFYFEVLGEKKEFYDSLKPKEKKVVDKYDEFVNNRFYSFYIY